MQISWEFRACIFRYHCHAQLIKMHPFPFLNFTVNLNIFIHLYWWMVVCVCVRVCLCVQCFRVFSNFTVVAVFHFRTARLLPVSHTHCPSWQVIWRTFEMWLFMCVCMRTMRHQIETEWIWTVLKWETAQKRTQANAKYAKIFSNVLFHIFFPGENATSATQWQLHTDGNGNDDDDVN